MGVGRSRARHRPHYRYRVPGSGASTPWCRHAIVERCGRPGNSAIISPEGETRDRMVEALNTAAQSFCWRVFHYSRWTRCMMNAVQYIILFFSKGEAWFLLFYFVYLIYCTVFLQCWTQMFKMYYSPFDLLDPFKCGRRSQNIRGNLFVRSCLLPSGCHINGSLRQLEISASSRITVS